MARILYIEDNIDNRQLVRRILLAADFDVELAGNAYDGIEMARENPPDLILMDISMPDMDGLEATEHMRTMRELDHVPIVALTANAMDGDRERTLDAGCDGYIPKPVDVDRLPEEVTYYLRSRR